MNAPAPTAPHVDWPMGTTWCQKWTAIRWSTRCQRWYVSLDGRRRAFVSGAYAAYVEAKALREVAQVQAQQRAARVERAIFWRHPDGAVRYGMNRDEARADSAYHILYTQQGEIEL